MGRRGMEFAKSATLTACKYGHNPVTMIDMPTENISIDAWTVNKDRILLPLACLVSIFRSDDHSTPLLFFNIQRSPALCGRCSKINTFYLDKQQLEGIEVVAPMQFNTISTKLSST